MNQFSTYENLKGKVQSNQITIDLLHSIILNNPYKERIEEARLGKLDKQKLKETLPAITPHGTFKEGQKCNDKLIQFSGYLFIDVDKFKGDINSLKRNLINRPEIKSCWLSISGNGIHALATIEGLTQDNFRNIHLNYLSKLEKDLDITCDRKVCTISSGLVISSDNNLLVNTITIPLDANEFTSRTILSHQHYIKKDKMVLEPMRQNHTRSENTEYLDDSTIDEFEHFTNIENHDKWILCSRLDYYPTPIVEFEEGRVFFRCYIPYDKVTKTAKKIQNGERNYLLSLFLHNLIILNPDKTKLNFISFMHNCINQYYCIEPLPLIDIEKMVSNKYNRRFELEPVLYKEGSKYSKKNTKRYWINPEEENKSRLLGEYLRNKSKSKIDQFFGDELPNINTKVSMNTISKHTGLSIITLKRRLTIEMKEIMQIHNKEIDNNKPKRKRY